MDTEIEPNSPSPSSPAQRDNSYVKPKHSRKKKLAIFVIVAGASAFGTFAWVNRSLDPSNWESMRTDYKNTK